MYLGQSATSVLTKRKTVCQIPYNFVRIKLIPTHYVCLFYLQSTNFSKIISISSFFPILQTRGHKNHRINWANGANLSKWLWWNKWEKQELSVLIYPLFYLPTCYRGHKTGWNNSLCQFSSSRNGSSRGLICDVWENFLHITQGGFHITMAPKAFVENWAT